MQTRLLPVLFLLVSAVPRIAAAQLPPFVPIPATENVWAITGSIGYALTSGNKDTSTLNVGYDVIFDPKKKNLMRSDGLYILGRSEGLVTTERLVVNGRDEYRFHPRAFVFSQLQYVQDRFKNIEYLVSPTAGFGVRVVETPATRLSIDTGAGSVWEKNPDAAAIASGAFTYAEKFSHALNAMTTITQSFSALHKTADVGDALFILNASVSATLTARTQIKVELLDTYKRRVPSASVVNNDIAVVVALVYKN